MHGLDKRQEAGPQLLARGCNLILGQQEAVPEGKEHVFFSECLLRLGVLCVFVVCLFWYGPFCHGAQKNLRCLHGLQHSFFKHLFNLYYVIDVFNRRKGKLSGITACIRKIAALVLFKLFINGNEKCQTSGSTQISDKWL